MKLRSRVYTTRDKDEDEKKIYTAELFCGRMKKNSLSKKNRNLVEKKNKSQKSFNIPRRFRSNTEELVVGKTTFYLDAKLHVPKDALKKVVSKKLN